MEWQVHSLTHAMKALASGILVGVTLVTGYSFVEAWIRPVPPGATVIMSPADIGFFALLLSLYYATVISMICVPLWLLLSKFRVAGPSAAALLGFTGTLGYWIISNYPPLQSAQSGLPYALCGAAAGLATWWRGIRR